VGISFGTGSVYFLYSYKMEERWKKECVHLGFKLICHD
jgi:hypothetical protein